MLAGGEALSLVAAMSEEVADGALEEVTADRSTFLRLVTPHRLHKAAMAIKVLYPVALDDHGDAALVHRLAGARVWTNLRLLHLVLRQRMVDTRGLNGDGKAVRESAEDEGDASAQGVAGNDHVTVGGQLADVLENLAVVPLVIFDGEAFQEAVDGPDDQSSRVPRPDPNGGEDGGQDVQGHRLRPHSEVFGVIHQLRRVRAADGDHCDIPASLAVRLAIANIQIQPTPLSGVGMGLLDGHLFVWEQRLQEAQQAAGALGLHVCHERHESVVH
mmetsp:Transcript_114934/g.330047  ORF Transcript_114934/g.330047 Transcript_114934/m.330047 type:complete len:273 (+) Transcript_114934:406-1224(+)